MYGLFGVSGLSVLYGSSVLSGLYGMYGLYGLSEVSGMSGAFIWLVCVVHRCMTISHVQAQNDFHILTIILSNRKVQGYYIKIF